MYHLVTFMYHLVHAIIQSVTITYETEKMQNRRHLPCFLFVIFSFQFVDLLFILYVLTECLTHIIANLVAVPVSAGFDDSSASVYVHPVVRSERVARHVLDFSGIVDLTHDLLESITHRQSLLAGFNPCL